MWKKRWKCLNNKRWKRLEQKYWKVRTFYFILINLTNSLKCTSLFEQPRVCEQEKTHYSILVRETKDFLELRRSKSKLFFFNLIHVYMAKIYFTFLNLFWIFSYSDIIRIANMKQFRDALEKALKREFAGIFLFLFFWWKSAIYIHNIIS